MSTQLFSNLNEPSLARLLNSGAVGVIPTDTVYGLVGSASNPNAVKSVLAIKGRQYKPGTLIAANVEQLVKLGIKLRYLRAVEQFWPGAVSVVVFTEPKLEYLHSGEMSLPVRIPKKTDLIALLQITGPLLTTSANRPNKPTVGTIDEAQKVFGKTVDFYVDGGDLSERAPSTIIRIIDDTIEVLRQGAVTIDGK
jgi:L-threonylcarbamoyladenylate synthase